MPLHVKDKLALSTTDMRLGKLRLERCSCRKIEEAACLACHGVRGIECKQGGGGAAGGDQEVSAGEAEVFGISHGCLTGAVVGCLVGGCQGNRLELAIGCGIELDWEPDAMRVCLSSCRVHYEPIQWVRLNRERHEGVRVPQITTVSEPLGKVRAFVKSSAFPSRTDQPAA